MLSQGVSLLATHQAVDQSKVDALIYKNKSGLFCRTRGNHVMTDGPQKLGHNGLHVRIVFYQEDARHDCAQDAYQAISLTSRAHTFKGRFTLSASKLRGDTATRPRKPVAPEQGACIRNALGRHCGEAGVPGGPREGSSEGDRLRSDPLNLAGRAR